MMKRTTTVGVYACIYLTGIGFDIFCVVLLSSAIESTHSLDILKIKERIAYGVPHSVIRGQDYQPTPVIM